MEEKMRKIQFSRLKRKHRNDIRMKQKEALRTRKNLEGDMNIEYSARGKKIEEGYLKALSEC